MQNFIGYSVKMVTNLAEIPNELLKSMRAPKNETSSRKEKTYGGFTNDDWTNVGNDLKRGLINFGQSR